MPQTQPDRVEQLETFLERIDRKLDAINTDIMEIKISQAKTEERFNSVDQRFNAIDSQLADIKKSTDTQFAEIRKSTDTQLTDIKVQIRAQDSRLWTFITALILAVVGLLTKFLFFPQA
jgi:septal ring factor EnvC (AmiA/AmiB activator)